MSRALLSKSAQLAILFPGIGVKPCGREGDFFARYQGIMAPFLAEAGEVAGIALDQAFADGAWEHFSPGQAEFLAYAFSFACCRVYEELGYRPAYLAGHSMGIYAALAGAGVFSFGDGLRITRLAHTLGEELERQAPFGAGVVVGLSPQEVEQLLAGHGLSSLSMANSNNRSSSVWVGIRAEVRALLRLAEGAGALKTILLATRIPYHTPHFHPELLARFDEALREITWQPPSCPLISTLDHRLLTSPDELRAMTVANLTRPVHWPGVLARLGELGVEAALECGPGISLSQHARFIEGAPKHLNLNNLKRRLDY